MTAKRAPRDCDAALLNIYLFSFQPRTISGKVSYTIDNGNPEEGNLPPDKANLESSTTIPANSPQPRMCDPCLKHTR